MENIPKKVLCLHTVTHPGAFEKNLKFFSGKKDILLTFDDGHYSFYDQAFPLLKRYNIPAVLFIVSSLIDTDQPFWWDEIEYYLGKEEGRKQIQMVKTLPNIERLRFLEKLRALGDKPPLKTRQLTVRQLQEMQDAGIVIANHSHTHPMFDRCTDAELAAELEASRSFFEKNNLNGYHIFAYPNGNYNEQAERILRGAGIQYAFLFDHKVNHSQANNLRISRLSINDYTPTWKTRLIISGLHSHLLPLRKKIASLLG